MEKQKRCILVLLRHGESEGNMNHRFSGTNDELLTANGRVQALEAGFALKSVRFDIGFTSNLSRAKDTLDIILSVSGCKIPITILDKLNERNYGVLQGMLHKDAIEKFGRENIALWKNSYIIGPENGENLTDVYNRTTSAFNENILPKLILSHNVIVVCHNGSLRALIRNIENADPDYVAKLSIKNCMPITYEFDCLKNKFVRLEDIPKVT